MKVTNAWRVFVTVAVLGILLVQYAQYQALKEVAGFMADILTATKK